MPGDERGFGRLFRRRSQGQHDGVEKLGLLDRLGQISRQAELAAERGVAAEARGAKHHDHDVAVAGESLDLGGQLETVHLGHVGVGQDELDRTGPLGRPRG